MKKKLLKTNQKSLSLILVTLLLVCLSLHVKGAITSFDFKDATNVNNGSTGATTTEFGRYYLEITSIGKYYRLPAASSSISLTASTICETNGMSTTTSSSAITIDGVALTSKYVQLFISPNYDITGITLYSSGGTAGKILSTIATLSKSSTYNGSTGNYSTLSGATLSGTTTTACSSLSFTCSPVTYIPKNTYILIMESASGVLPSKLDITYKDPNPNIILTSGIDPAPAMETLSMTPVVYTYNNVVDNANVVSGWFSDNTYTVTASAPSGLSLDKNTTAKTVTLSGSPLSTTAGTYFYKVSVNETGGNSIQGSVVIAPYNTPAPTITLSSGGINQILKAGAPLTNIVYTIANGTNASFTGLPTGLSGSYINGTYTISGTIDAGVTPGLYTYTVTAASLVGYAGLPVTTTGSVLVKSTTAKQILYITATGTVSANDTKLYPMLNNSINYIVTLKMAEATSPAVTVYNPYDLIVLNETVASANLEAAALKSVDKPILNLKSYVYAAAPKWGWGTPDNGSATNLNVTVKQPTHPIFNGITLNAGSLDILSAVGASKGVQPADITLLGSINLATAPKTASGEAVAIHDVPASVRGVVNSKYLMIPVSDNSYGNFTSNAMMLLSNAVDYLLNGTQFVAPSLQISSFIVNSVNATIDNAANKVLTVMPIGTDLTALQPIIALTGTGTVITPLSGIAQDFTISESSPINYTVTDGINSKVYAVTVKDGTTGLVQTKLAGVSFDGKIIHNNANLDLQVFDTTGRLMTSSNKNIDMSNNLKGIYFVKNNSGVLKIALVK